MHVTSNYYRCRAQRAATQAEPMALFVDCDSSTAAAAAVKSTRRPLRPSSQTLRRLAALHKSDQHRVA